VAKLVISEESWKELEHANNSCRAKGCRQHLSVRPLQDMFEVEFISQKEQAAILADMFRVTGSAPKKEEGKGKGGKKQKGEEAEE